MTRTSRPAFGSRICSDPRYLMEKLDIDEELADLLIEEGSRR